MNLFNKKKNKILLDDDEKIILQRSLLDYKEKLIDLMSNQEVANDKLHYICVHEYFHSVEKVIEKLNNI
jgi:hypothetical protein